MNQSAPIRQAIAGVAPPELGEVTVMTVWPSIGGLGIGRTLGRLYRIPVGIGPVFTVGKLIALLSIPLALALYIGAKIPKVLVLFIPNPLCRHYRLTNRRVIVQQGILSNREKASVALDDFDAIDVVVQDGQQWYPCGDLVFRKGPVQTFRLDGVQRPETFRQTCLKTQRAHFFVGRDVKAQAAVA